jgi:hypothetical protein
VQRNTLHKHGKDVGKKACNPDFTLQQIISLSTTIRFEIFFETLVAAEAHEMTSSPGNVGLKPRKY